MSTMTVGVCVHAVNTAAHPTVPDGWRWAVHLGTNWGDVSSCLNAGWQPTQVTASMAGEAAAVCAARVARLLSVGADVVMSTTVLEFDPIPADGDAVSIGA